MGIFEITIAIIALLVALVGVFYQIRESKRKNKINNFDGAIGEYCVDNSSFINFLFTNDGKIIHLDTNLNDNQNPQINENGIFDFSIYFDYKNKIEGGIYVRIEVNKNDDFYYDNRLSSKRIVGNFKIIGIQGPQQGWMTISMKPVNIELIK